MCVTSIARIVACKYQGLLYVGNFTRVIFYWLWIVPVLCIYDVVMFVLMNERHRVCCWYFVCFFWDKDIVRCWQCKCV